MKVLRLLSLTLLASWLFAQGPMPRIVQKNGRFAMLVDDKPFLILGAQVHNSSAWPAMLGKVWPTIEAIHANTVEMPVYWEQMEQRQGQFDFTVVDALLKEAREHHVHLILLWFGTWKNASQHYMPEWMKNKPQRYFHVLDQHGKVVDSPSPFATASLEADKRAFTTLMTHLRDADSQHTVIMVQVENEPGTWGSIRDYSPSAQKVFEAVVPANIAAMMHAKSGLDWKSTFGEDADEFFHAWAVAKYINEVAAAGSAVYKLPLSVNVALRDPLAAKRGSYESGGATDNVIDIWKAAAPAIAVIGPDIYMPDSERYLKVLELYSRPDNPLFVPETGNAASYGRYFFAALGHGAIGWAPFGMDETGFSNAPLGAEHLDAETLAAFSMNYQLMELAGPELAQLSFDGKVKTAIEIKDKPKETVALDRWTAAVSYGLPAFGFGDHPPGNKQPIGRAMIAQLSPDEFLVGGFFCRIDFAALAADKHRQYMRVEEGSYQSGKFVPVRIWNGDQTDWGLNFGSTAQLLHVTLSTY